MSSPYPLRSWWEPCAECKDAEACEIAWECAEGFDCDACSGFNFTQADEDRHNDQHRR